MNDFSNQVQIPAYGLYGEFLEQIIPDVLHFEAIRERSQKHDWSIKPHRHNNLAQILFLQSPNVVVRVGNTHKKTDRPVILFVPPMLVHGFQFEKTVIGGVVSVPVKEFTAALDAVNINVDRFKSPLEVPDDHDAFDALCDLIQSVEREFHGVRLYRNEALISLLRLLVIQLCRTSSTERAHDRPALISRHEEQIRHFCSLVETHYRTDMRLEDYADLIGISKVQLTRNCDRILGTSPNQVLVNRRLMEAKRQLTYTQLSVSEVAYKLGFKDVGYFSRFFKRMSGHTPSDYRSETQSAG